MQVAIKQALPQSARRLGRSLRFLFADLADVFAGRRSKLTPPRRAIEEIGGFDFAAIGQHLAHVAVSMGQLSPAGSILDVGCGYGRLAVPLLDHLARGRYEGFDVSRKAARWCQRRISAQHPSFRFSHVDVRNGHYNRRGRIEPEHFVFPFPDGSFNVVFAASLFTHLTPAAFRQYTFESARVLKPGGRLVASFFILNAESRERIAAGRGQPKFEVVGEEVALQHAHDPEAAIALSESLVLETLRAAGLGSIAVHDGGWCERAEHFSYQDFVVAVKPDT